MLERYTRQQVFLTHLTISLIIFSGLAVAMVAHWFPGPFFASDGGWQGMRIIAAVDLILGPALTLIFFNPKKKQGRALLFDLISIGTIQAIALVWGTWTVYHERTVAIAFSKDQFFSVSHGALTEANAALRVEGKKPGDIYALSNTHPREIFVTPLKADEAGQYLADIFNGLPEIQLRTDRYTELAPHWDEIAEWAVDIQQFVQTHPDLADDVESLGEQLADLRFFRMKLRFGRAIAGFDSQSRELVHIFTFQPPASPKNKAGESQTTSENQ